MKELDRYSVYIMTGKKKIALISSAFNEKDNIIPLYERIRKTVSSFRDRYEFTWLVVDNASTDGTDGVLRRLAAEDRSFQVIFNTRNFGHILSPYYGMMQAEGDAVLYLASDQQDPPELIPEMIKKWEKGSLVVLARKKSTKEFFPVSWIRRGYYRILSVLNDTNAELAENCTGFGLFDRKVIEKIREMNDPYPYIRGLVCYLGYKRDYVDFEQPLRRHGRTKNNFYTLYDNAMLGIISFSKVPLRVAAFAGFILSVLSFLMAVVYLVFKLTHWYHFPTGTVQVLIALFFFSSVQLFFLGVIGEYLGAVLTQVCKRPAVIEKERINI